MSGRAYADRVAAGDVLAARLRGYARTERPVVLGLPRGGVPVAARVAAALGAALDVVVVRKLGVPGRPELAMGAVAGVGTDVEVVRNDDVLAAAGVGAAAFDTVYELEVAELRRREDAYRGGRPPADVTGRTVLVVDDGLATGATMLAALVAVRRRRPAVLVAAVPVGARPACELLRRQADAVVCPSTPPRFRAVGEVYDDFRPTSDHEVRRLLAGSRGPPGPPRTGTPRPGPRPRHPGPRTTERRTMTTPPLDPVPGPGPTPEPSPAPGPAPDPGPMPGPGPAPDPGPGPLPGPGPTPPGPGPGPGPDPGPPTPQPGPIT